MTEEYRPRSFPVTRGLDPRVHHLRKTQGHFRKRMDYRVKPGNDSGASFAVSARAGMLTCNDHNGFAVIAHGPHCHHRADPVRGGAGAGAAIRYGRAGCACRYECTAGGRQRCDITARCRDTDPACGQQCNAAARYR
jgi:hypothetical protein